MILNRFYTGHWISNIRSEPVYTGSSLSYSQKAIAEVLTIDRLHWQIWRGWNALCISYTNIGFQEYSQ